MILITGAGVIAFLKFLWLELETICTVVGALAIALTTLDQAVRRALKKNPKSRTLKFFDKMLFGPGNLTVNLGKALDKALQRKKR